MALTPGIVEAHTSSAGNPITYSYEVLPGTAALILALKGQSATSRAGGAPTLGSTTFAQANSTQKAAASPEASAEVWTVVNPTPGTHTITIPNTGALTIFRRTIAVRGGTAAVDQSNGANATAANPSPGAVTPTEDGAFIFAIVATGAQSWAPSARVGTLIGDHDDGADGTGYQYTIQANRAAITLSWTFATSDDYGAVVVAIKETAPPNQLLNYQRGKSSGLSVGGIG